MLNDPQGSTLSDQEKTRRWKEYTENGGKREHSKKRGRPSVKWIDSVRKPSA